MPLHRKRGVRGAIGAAVAAVTLFMAASASALCTQNCAPPPPPPPPPVLTIVGSQQQGVGTWTLSARAGGSDQTQSFYNVGGDGEGMIGLTTFTATGPGGTAVTVTARDTRNCESLLGDPPADTTETFTASGIGKATVSFFPNQTCPPDDLLFSSVQNASATQGSVRTPTLTFASNFFYNAQL